MGVGNLVAQSNEVAGIGPVKVLALQMPKGKKPFIFQVIPVASMNPEEKIISIETRRYSELIKRILLTYNHDVTIRVDSKRYSGGSEGICRADTCKSRHTYYPYGSHSDKILY